MSLKNFYPEKHVDTFRAVHVEMFSIIDGLKKVDYPVEVKRSAYVIARNETRNGQSVIGGTNVCGAQSDCGRWPSQWDSKVQSVCVQKENLTGKERGFVVFDTLENGLAFLCERIEAKGIFIGEHVDGKYYKGDVCTPEQLADAYEDEWVYGENHKTTLVEIKDFVSMYNQALKIFI
jgi:hypothetical protein